MHHRQGVSKNAEISHRQGVSSAHHRKGVVKGGGIAVHNFLQFAQFSAISAIFRNFPQFFELSANFLMVISRTAIFGGSPDPQILV
jgi:hypothetical protein